jgi:hypothetical protein
MDHNQPRVSSSDCSGLGLVPTIERPTKKEKQAGAGKFLLEIRLAPVGLDLRVREPISAAAHYSSALGEFLLPYDDVRRATSPDAALLEFLQSSYEAAADRGGWDRPELERQER